MTIPYGPDEARQLLAEAIRAQPQSNSNPLPISDWIAMSLLQKAVRRGHEDLALRAAVTLLNAASDRLWRRLAGIAFEDVGLGDLRIVALVIAGLSGKRFRMSIGGDWRVASYVVTLMARAPKCRSPDDLLMMVELHPQYERARRSFATFPASDLLQIVSSNSLPERAIAAWYSAGTYWRTTRRLRPRRGQPKQLFNHLKDVGHPSILVDLAEAGFKKGAGMLAPFMAMLYPMLPTSSTMTEDDRLPPAAMVGDVPGWVWDLHSHEGRASLEVFLKGDSATASWVRAHVPTAQQPRFLGGVLFRTEGGLVRQRLRWGVGDQLRESMDLECHGPYCPNASHLLKLMRDDIPALNDARTHASLLGRAGVLPSI
jgi:hypothetical protein